MLVVHRFFPDGQAYLTQVGGTPLRDGLPLVSWSRLATAELNPPFAQLQAHPDARHQRQGPGPQRRTTGALVNLVLLDRVRVRRLWWWEEDSNLRRLSRRVYSAFPLATRASHPAGADGRRGSVRAATDDGPVALRPPAERELVPQSCVMPVGRRVSAAQRLSVCGAPKQPRSAPSGSGAESGGRGPRRPRSPLTRPAGSGGPPWVVADATSMATTPSPQALPSCTEV